MRFRECGDSMLESFFAHGRHGHGHGGRGRGFGGGSHRHGGGRGDGMEEGGMLRRLLGHGDLRFVILALLEEKPRHGYELIKALEEKSFGHYTPSPGVIYPTLTFLEEGGYASASTEDNKKLYTLTEEGKVLLDENRDFVEAILNRMARVGEKMSKLREWFGRDEGFGEKEDKGDSIRHAMHRLRAELFPFVDAGKEQRKKIIEIIEQAAAQIRALRG